ncbi:OLC1v1003591C1 [Oldenlandia corymbosa var. corymbosa]|uniref:OLC1v1003591C1 n=1 Tax=Oldenlandia corymbosa var. corymbosa TaxID=529605 RepID=A0AAV1DAD9_OLDCO|nr:OLC1v1003591C1 [Oldenlandia corymbosa var. corymbosa]
MEIQNRSVPILREWFDHVDSENKGNITASQLQGAFAVGNLRFPLSVVQQMIRMYDFDRNGTMNFQEFVELNKFLLKVQQAFADLERGLGYLVSDDVYKGLVKIGMSLDSPAFYTVCESFDQKKSGRFRLDDFISLCIFVQSASCQLQDMTWTVRIFIEAWLLEEGAHLARIFQTHDCDLVPIYIDTFPPPFSIIKNLSESIDSLFFR